MNNNSEIERIEREIQEIKKQMALVLSGRSSVKGDKDDFIKACKKVLVELRLKLEMEKRNVGYKTNKRK